MPQHHFQCEWHSASHSFPNLNEISWISVGKKNDPEEVSVVFDFSKSETRFMKLNPKMGSLTKRCYILVRKYSEATGNNVLNDVIYMRKCHFSTPIGIYNILRFILASNAISIIIFEV